MPDVRLLQDPKHQTAFKVAIVNGDRGQSFRYGMPENDVASGRSSDNKTEPFQGSDHFLRFQLREPVRHTDSRGFGCFHGRDDPFIRLTRNFIAVLFQYIDIPCDRILDIFFRFLKSLTFRVASRQCRNRRHKTAFFRGFKHHRIGM